MKISEKIVKKLINDLSGRCGLGNEWDNIDHSIQEEIIIEWERIVQNQLDEI